MIEKHTLSRNGIYSEAVLMDNMEYMAKFPDKFFDLAVVDPEYGIKAGAQTMGRGTASRLKKKEWDSKPPDGVYFEELFRISKNQIIFGGNYFRLPPTRGFIVWDKGNSMKGRSFSECEYIWTSFDVPARIILRDALGNGDFAGRFHKTMKPIYIYKKIYEMHGNTGYKIIDTHLGSGSNRIAAYDMGINFWSCENDPDYFKDSVKWFDEYSAQGKLFDI